MWGRGADLEGPKQAGRWSVLRTGRWFTCHLSHLRLPRSGTVTSASGNYPVPLVGGGASPWLPTVYDRERRDPNPGPEINPMPYGA